MKTGFRRAAQGAVAAMAVMAVVPAKAVIVFDPLNFLVNIGSNVMLHNIYHQLKDTGQGTVIYNTQNIDNSTKSIDKSTTSIDKTTNLSYQLDITNTNIDASFTWIINNNGGGGEIIPIPKEVKDRLAAVMNAQSVEDYTAHYKPLEEYETKAFGNYGDATAVESARARRAANTALVQAVSSHEAELADDAEAFRALQQKASKAEGRNAQLQIANALAASEINQLAKMRSMMVVAEAQRAADAQAAADKDARAMAVGKAMRAGLDSAITVSRARAATY